MISKKKFCDILVEGYEKDMEKYYVEGDIAPVIAVRHFESDDEDDDDECDSCCDGEECQDAQPEDAVYYEDGIDDISDYIPRHYKHVENCDEAPEEEYQEEETYYEEDVDETTQETLSRVANKLDSLIDILIQDAGGDIEEEDADYEDEDIEDEDADEDDKEDDEDESEEDCETVNVTVEEE